MPTFSNTHGFVSMALSTASKSTVLGLPYLADCRGFTYRAAKFLEPSAYCTIINNAFIVGTTDEFSCFHSNMSLFKV